MSAYKGYIVIQLFDEDDNLIEQYTRQIWDFKHAQAVYRFAEDAISEGEAGDY